MLHLGFVSVSHMFTFVTESFYSLKNSTRGSESYTLQSLKSSEYHSKNSLCHSSLSHLIVIIKGRNKENGRTEYWNVILSSLFVDVFFFMKWMSFLLTWAGTRVAFPILALLSCPVPTIFRHHWGVRTQEFYCTTAKSTLIIMALNRQSVRQAETIGPKIRAPRVTRE